MSAIGPGDWVECVNNSDGHECIVSLGELRQVLDVGPGDDAGEPQLAEPEFDEGAARLQPALQLKAQQPAVTALQIGIGAAARFGLGLDHPDYHLFVLGDVGTGRSTLLQQEMRRNSYDEERGTVTVSAERARAMHGEPVVKRKLSPVERRRVLG